MSGALLVRAVICTAVLVLAESNLAHGQGDPQPRSIGGQCAQEVHAQYNAAEHRWYFYGAGVNSAQWQRFYDCIDRRTSPGSAGAQSTPTPRRQAARTAKKPASTEESNVRGAFSGSESRIAAMNYVNTDCSSGPLPDVRVVTQPTNGELRMEPIKYPVNRSNDKLRAHCNGKIVDAVAVFYKSKDAYVGIEKLVLDVDFRHGAIKRFRYAIDIR